MDSSRPYWSEWIINLRQRDLHEWAAWALESSGPLQLITAQLLYITEPLATPGMSLRFRALAHLLEDEGETRDFTQALKGYSP